MARRMILEEKSFAIGADELQWLLFTRKKKLNSETIWTEPWYYPTLTELLWSLIEWKFRRSKKRHETIENLSRRIDEVYALVEQTTKTLRRRRKLPKNLGL